jgi:ATP-dependent DNA helicase RecQ
LKSALQILNHYFGYDSFRKEQEEIIEAIISSKQVIAVLPTGSGKSICYQVPALLSDNFSIVISPLIALMKDQVDSINQREEVAAFINSTMSSPEAEEVLNKISLGKIKLLYLAPEKLESLKFAERIKELNPSYLFIDEAHCISQWGHNFRPSYQKIKEFYTHTGIRKIAAFTATATPEVVEDIIAQLELKNPKIFVRGFERNNLNLNILITKNKKKKCIELLRQIPGSAIIYTSSRKKCEELTAHLVLNGINCSYYHAGMPSPERRIVQEKFISDNEGIITATNAFGMGIDKKNIRLIIHYDIPGSIENYYQEIGRAGRDGEESYCYLFYDEKDLAIQNYFIENSHPKKELIKNIYKAVCDFNRISMGSKLEKELIIDQEYISSYTGVKISHGLLYASLKYLENGGYLKQVSAYEKKDSIQFLVNSQILKKFVKSPGDGQVQNIVLLLLKEFQGNIFRAPIKMSIENLSSTLGIPVNEMNESLIILDNLGIISYQPAIPKDTVTLLTPRVPDENLVLNYKLINESYLNARKKLDKINELVFTQECRFKFILNYFGEKIENFSCGKCDNCSASVKISDYTTEFISDAVIGTLREAKDYLSEKTLMNILRGENIKESLTLFDAFGACKKFSPAEIKIVIQELISKEIIDRSYGKINYLGLKDVRQNNTKHLPESRQIAEVNNYNDDLSLFNLLREIRKRAADRFTQSAYLICPDNVLREIVRKKPSGKEELLSIKGFNTRMFNKAGTEFLEAINSYLKEKGKPETGQKVTALPQSILETQKLLLKKYRLKEIADTLRLTEAVISMQIETIIEYFPATDVSHLFNEEAYNKIIEEAEKGFNNLKELKERLPAGITYPQIRIAAAKFKFTSRSHK